MARPPDHISAAVEMQLTAMVLAVPTGLPRKHSPSRQAGGSRSDGTDVGEQNSGKKRRLLLTAAH